MLLHEMLREVGCSFVSTLAARQVAAVDRLGTDVMILQTTDTTLSNRTVSTMKGFS